MDFSAANLSLWNLVIQLGMIAGAILVANFLRQKLGFIRKSLMPTAVLAGFILLILKHLGVLPVDNEFYEMLVYHCIALGFIAMSLRTVKKSAQKSDLTGLKSGAVIVSTYLVQAVAGLIITIALAYTFMPDLFKAAGLLLPMGYGQGPGQANNIGSTYEALGFTGGRSFGLAIAAAGYICACVVGVILLNILAKKGAVRPKGKAAAEEDLSVGFFQDHDELPVSDSLDKLSVQLAMVLLVYLGTFLFTWGLTSGLSAISEGVGNAVNTLLWGFNFIIGSALAILVRFLLDKAKGAGLVKRQYQNNYLLNRLSGFFFDIMIVAGIASIDLQDLTGLWAPFLLMAVAGGVVTWFWLKFVCKRVYGDYYYEGLISMYGMLTGTIGSGILLVREIDPDLSTPAANNLVIGSSYGIVLGAPMLIFVSLASQSTILCFATLGIVLVYLALLTLLILLVHRRKKPAESE